MSKNILELQTIEDLSLKADRLLIANEHEKLKALLKPFLGIEYSFDSYFNEARYHYALGNCFQSIYNYQKLDWFSDEISKSVISYRKALHAVQKINPLTNSSLYLQSCIETNLGNSLSSQGRAFCCIPFWDSAYRCQKNPVSIISKATNELFIASSIYDQSHREHHYFTAYQLIQLGLKHLDKLHPEQRAAYSKGGDLMGFKAWYEEYFSLDAPSDFETYKMEFESRKHRSYLKWCAENRLLINDLNDISVSEIVYQDILTLPDITRQINDTLSLHEELMYHGNFDELKNDYCYARYLVFTAKDIPNEQPHLSNDTYPQFNDMAHTITNLKASHYKSAFRILYSLFDKIAYFVHRFFDLNDINKDHRISFDSIFRELNSKKWKPNSELKDSKNHFLHALFYILKDIRDVKEATPVSNWLDPDANAFSDIRNAIEHRSLKIIDDFGCEAIQSDKYYIQRNLDNLVVEVDDIKVQITRLDDEITIAKKEQKTALKTELETKKLSLDKQLQEKQLKLRDQQKLSSHSLLIGVSEFESRLMTLMKLTRNSVMYLSLAVHFDEQHSDDASLIIPREVPLK